jgi:hypothetical protein
MMGVDKEKVFDVSVGFLSDHVPYDRKLDDSKTIENCGQTPLRPLE